MPLSDDRLKSVRRWISATVVVLLAVAAWALSPSRLGGAFTGQPEDLDKRLSPAAHELIRQAYSDLGNAPIVDYHAHLMGIGAGGSGAEVRPGLLSGWNPIKRYKGALFLSACGSADYSQMDQDYIERLVRLAAGSGHPIRIHLLAMDRYYRSDGVMDRTKIDFYMPNEEVVRQAERHPGLFVPVISVHPNRPDAWAELEKWGQRGVRFVKWLPNAQGIDPSDPRNDGYYRIMKKYGMILLTHTGMEKSVDSSDQAFGNPLLLRQPLDQGVRVIMAHAASSGSNEDLDHPGTRASSFDLFIRMMEVKRYEGLLFADLSATTQINRTPRPILELIRRPEWHGRLVNGSDYPLPAVNCMIWTQQLAWLGMITKQEQRNLNAIYNCNPLLFDFVLKRTLRDPQTGARLPGRVFLENPGLGMLHRLHAGRLSDMIGPQ